jgi:tRNA A-37 threonylcarbamoyl transferase component Bud32
VVAAAPQLNRYGWLLAGAATALILLVGRALLPDSVGALEGLFRDWVVSGAPYDRPLWAVFIEDFTAVVVVAFAGGVLPRASRKTALLSTLGLVWGLLLLEIALLSWLGSWTRLLLPVIALLVGLGVSLACHAPIKPAARPAAPAPARKFTNVSGENLAVMARNLQRQGQLDLAFETYRRCPATPEVMDALHGLGLEFDSRHQGAKAKAVFTYMAERDPKYKALADRSVSEDPAPPRLKPIRPTASIDKPDARDRAANAPKRTLGRYEIERELGQGAMGTVYLGRDPKINRVVAIKAISLAQEFEDADLEEVKSRFFREAEMAGRLNHPGIVTVYDAGEDQGLAYIAMEFLKGRHLSHFAEGEHLLPAPKVLDLVARLADALHYAHRQNVVHRDIKPANIMYDVDTDELKITDFGIARLTDTSRTKTGIVLGTPSFMSPEQLEGGALDGRTDLFALGVSLYHLLAGQLPFRAGSMTQLMHKIASEPHVPLRTIRPEMPECVETIIARALEKNPEDRYQTGAELAAAVRSCAKALGA